MVLDGTRRYSTVLTGTNWYSSKRVQPSTCTSSRNDLTIPLKGGCRGLGRRLSYRWLVHSEHLDPSQPNLKALSG
eukprot:6779624-Prymnesium_polylepis.1